MQQTATIPMKTIDWAIAIAANLMASACILQGIVY
jgi:hypothetical protein